MHTNKPEAITPEQNEKTIRLDLMFLAQVKN